MYICMYMYMYHQGHCPIDTVFQFLNLNATSDVEHMCLHPDDDSISEAISPPDGFMVFGTAYANVYVRM